MAAAKTDLYIVLVNAGVPEETAGKLAVAHSKLDVEATLIAALEAIGKVRKWQQTVDEGCREMLAKDKPAIVIDRDREKGKVLMVCADRDGGPGQRRYRVDQILNSVEYHPGDFLTPDEVRLLCDACGWQVHISPERQPLLPREEWSR